MSPLNVPAPLYDIYWKADTGRCIKMIDTILAQGSRPISGAADSWFVCALAERDPAAAERALVALGEVRVGATTLLI